MGGGVDDGGNEEQSGPVYSQLSRPTPSSTTDPHPTSETRPGPPRAELWWPERFTSCPGVILRFLLALGVSTPGQWGGGHLPLGGVKRWVGRLSPLVAGLVPEGSAGSAHHPSWKRRNLRSGRAPCWETCELWKSQPQSWGT